MEELKKEEERMKRLTLTALLLIALTTGAIAHQGSIGLYTDTNATACAAVFVPYVGQEVTIMYFRSDSGPDGISAAEFKVVGTAAVLVGTYTPSAAVSVTQGAITSNLSVALVGCTGSGENYVNLGTVNILVYVPIAEMVQVLAAEGIADPPFEPRVAICPDPKPIVGVLGGYFAPNGSCDIGTEEKTWGAIKEMYRD